MTTLKLELYYRINASLWSKLHEQSRLQLSNKLWNDLRDSLGMPILTPTKPAQYQLIDDLRKHETHK